MYLHKSHRMVIHLQCAYQPKAIQVPISDTQIKSIQKAWIIGVEGAKGKQVFGRNSSTAIAAFGRTATHVFRMVMLEACGVDPENWPSGGE